MLPAMAGRDARDRNSIDLPGLDAPVPDLAGVRLVASETLGFAPVDDDVLAAFRRGRRGDRGSRGDDRPR